jgi:kynureninase
MNQTQRSPSKLSRNAFTTIKYLNGGPGAVARYFRKGQAFSTRFCGWWGHEQTSRFLAQQKFTPKSGASGWQLSAPPILSMAPLRASLEQFGEAGMAAIRQKPLLLSRYLESLIARHVPELQLVTPSDPRHRGSPLTFRWAGVDPVASADNAKRLVAFLAINDVLVDFRFPTFIRVAAAPLYNSFEDLFRFVMLASDWARGRG